MDMKTRFLTTLSLVVVLLAACAPTPVTLGPVPTEENGGAVQQSVSTSIPNIVAPEVATATPDIVEPEPTVLPIATSRGPNLEATDPTTVSLASGQIQIVEFFRFT